MSRRRRKSIDTATRGVSGNPAKRRVPPVPPSVRSSEERAWRKTFKGVVAPAQRATVVRSNRAQGRGKKA